MHSLADFIAGVDPYEFLIVVDLKPSVDRVRVAMTVDAMHDGDWTQRLVTGRENELDKLANVIDRKQRRD